MKLSEKQRLFSLNIMRLLFHAHVFGYEITFGHAFRCETCKVGKKRSLHKLCLAMDLNLWKDGKYLTKTEDHKKLGEYWESLHPLCTWGGRFGDGNHYSVTHRGRK